MKIPFFRGRVHPRALLKWQQHISIANDMEEIENSQVCLAGVSFEMSLVRPKGSAGQTS